MVLLLSASDCLRELRVLGLLVEAIEPLEGPSFLLRADVAVTFAGNEDNAKRHNRNGRARFLLLRR